MTFLRLSVGVIAGPRNRSGFRLERIEVYLNHGGRVLILLMNTLLPDVRKSGWKEYSRTGAWKRG